MLELVNRSAFCLPVNLKQKVWQDSNVEFESSLQNCIVAFELLSSCL